MLTESILLANVDVLFLLQIHLSKLQLTAALYLQRESEFPEGVPYFLRNFCMGIPNSLAFFFRE